MSFLRSRITAIEILEILRRTALEALALSQHDPRWERLRLGLGPEVNLRDRFRGALISGAVRDAMGRADEGVWPNAARAAASGLSAVTCKAGLGRSFGV